METLEENKKLYLVYDEWDDDIPLPNLKESSGNTDFNLVGDFINNYTNFFFPQEGYMKNYSTIKYLKLSEIKEYSNKKIFYAVKTRFGLEELIEEKNFKFKETIIKELQHNSNFYFLFIREHESETANDIQCLINYFDINNISKDKIYLLSNNPLLENKSKEVGINFYKINTLSGISSNVFNQLGSNFIEDKKGKFGICFNNSPRNHRYALLLYLKSKNLLEKCDWSLISRSQIDKYELSKYFYKNDLNDMTDSMEYFKQIKTKFSESEINDSVKKELKDIDITTGGVRRPEPVDIFEHSYVNLVTETMFDDNLKAIHVTEKSFRPLYFYQIPLILSTCNHINYMKKEFGFDFYDDFIDHSYDNETNQIKRFKLYTNEVNRLFNNIEAVKKYYKSNKKRFESNKKIVENLRFETKDYLWLNSLIS